MIFDVEFSADKTFELKLKPEAFKLPPVTLPLELTLAPEIAPAVMILPPVTLPVAEINPPVDTLPPVILPVTDTNCLLAITCMAPKLSL